MADGFALSAAALVVSGCATLQDTSNICEFSDGTLAVSGQMDDRFEACVTRYANALDTLVVDTRGGDVNVGMSVADIVSKRGVDFVVDGSCQSSCANYLIPVARSVRIRSGSVVALHGSVDHQRVRDVEARFPGKAASVKAAAMRQDAFADRHDVPPGWLLFRPRSRVHRLGFGPHLDGKPKLIAAPPTGMRVTHLLVTPDFLQSCLPSLDVRWDGEGAIAPKLRTKLSRNGYVSSRGMRCQASTDEQPPRAL